MKFYSTKLLLPFLIFSFTVGASAQMVTELTMDIDPSSMPEGIAIDPNNGDIYLSSIHLDKITKSDNNGKNSRDLISTGQAGYTFGTGMMIVKNQLFACGRLERAKKPIVLQIDLATQKVVNTFKLPDTLVATFNDLTVDNQFNAYLTDSDFSRIYKLDHLSGKIALFMEDVQIKGPNGICISDDQSKLYISSNTEGIRIVDIKTKKILNSRHEETVGRGIDGLKFYKNQLYVVYNYGGKEKAKQGLMQFTLSENGEDIIASKELTIGHAKNNIPTTVGIYKGHAYYVADSQFDNFNWNDNTVKRPADLTNTCVLKVDIRQ